MNATFTIISPVVIQDTAMIIGEMVRIRGKKRVWLTVNKVDTDDGSETYRMKPIYKPSPKSTLNKKSFFSKVKMKIYNNQ